MILLTNKTRTMGSLPDTALTQNTAGKWQQADWDINIILLPLGTAKLASLFFFAVENCQVQAN